MRNRKSEAIKEIMVVHNLSKEIMEDVFSLENFLHSDDKIKKRIRYKHDNTFTLFS